MASTRREPEIVVVSAHPDKLRPVLLGLRRAGFTVRVHRNAGAAADWLDRNSGLYRAVLLDLDTLRAGQMWHMAVLRRHAAVVSMGRNSPQRHGPLNAPMLPCPPKVRQVRKALAAAGIHGRSRLQAMIGRLARLTTRMSATASGLV